MFYKIKKIKNKLLIVFLFLYLLIYNAICQISSDEQETSDTQEISDIKYNKIEIKNEESNEIEKAPLLNYGYIITNYGSINNNNRIKYNNIMLAAKKLSKTKEIIYIVIILSSLLLCFSGIVFLSCKRIEGYFLLFISVSNILFTRKIIKCFLENKSIQNTNF